MDRRTFTKAFSASAVLLPVTTVAACSGAYDRSLSFKTFKHVMGEFYQLAQKSKVISHAPDGKTGWSLAQIAEHCAQSIDYAITGFPQAKSAFFQSTAGSAAFKVFSWRDKMSHDTSEAIPGAPALQATDTDKALAMLKTSIERFEKHTGPLKPHFAYGTLSKEEFTRANVYHIANHLSKIEVVAP
jgi:hypothetical protein